MQSCQLQFQTHAKAFKISENMRTIV